MLGTSRDDVFKGVKATAWARDVIALALRRKQ